MTFPPGTSVLCPIYIGRTLHLEALSQIVEQAAGGAGQTVLIGGEAGVGKSRLAAEAKTRAAASGFRILQGNCFESDRSLPYAALLDLLRVFCSTNSEDAIRSALGDSAADLVKLLPELSARFPDLAPAPLQEPGAEKQRLFRALLQFLIGKGAPAQGPVVIVIEDLHWSDDSSLEFLLHLARHLLSRPIVLLLTYRSDEIAPSLSHFLAELSRARMAMELRLQRLTIAELDAMLRAIFQMERPVSPAFRQSLYALTDGNPFFVEETLKEMISSGSLFLEHGRWDHKPVRDLQVPPSIQDTVWRRANLLSDEARHVLELASVAGRRFDFELLRDLTELDEPELLRMMKELVAAQLVTEESADQFSFRHALTREAVYRSLLIRERARDHGLVAQAIQRLHANTLDTLAGALAYHFYEAGLWDQALTYSQLAGERAQALYAPHTALDQFTRALEAAQHFGAAPAALYRKRGQVYETIGEFDNARADYEQAHSSALQARDVRSTWEALIELGSLWAGRDYQRTGDYYRQALDLASQIGDPPTLAHSLNRLGNWHANIGALDEALRLHRQALDIFQQANDVRGLADTLDLLGMTSQINGDLVYAVAQYQRAVGLFRQLDDRRGLVSSLATLALCGPSYIHDPSFSPFNLAQAMEQAEEALRLAQAIGWRSGEIYALHCLTICLGPQGELLRALELAQRGLEISQEIGHDQWLIGAHYDLGALYREIFALPEARRHLELALSLARAVGSSLWVGTVIGCLASVCVLQGDFSQAEELLNAELAADTPAQTQMQLLCWCARAELALARGQPDLALSVLDRLTSAAPDGAATVTIPRLAKLRGEALIALGRLAEAEQELRAAQQAASDQGARTWLWRIHDAFGKLYRTQGRRTQSEAEFRTAQKIVEDLAASIEDQALRSTFLENATTMLPKPAATSARRREKDDFGGLTARERQVAVLIAQGASNREVAGKLVVSERTVESHVTSILAKLGFPSRAKIAAWVVERGLARPVE